MFFNSRRTCVCFVMDLDGYDLCCTVVYVCFATYQKKAKVTGQIRRQITAADLEAADFDGDGIVVDAEFIIYKLKEMGKISQDDIAPIMTEFETLDFDNTGTLSTSDLLFSQSSLVAGGVLATQMSV